MIIACMICRAEPAPYGVSWPGFRRDQPDNLRGKRMRLCGFDGECHAQTIVRAQAAARRPWPWRGEPDALRARVRELTGEPPPETPAPPSPPPNQKSSPQGSLL